MSLLAALVGQTLDEKYRIEKQLGQGGMGAVYMATHVGTLRPVALKVIAPQFMAHPEFVERFRREAEAAGRLRHPNVVNVTDFGFAEIHKSKLAYLVMEYLDGCNLGDVLKEEKKLPLSWVVDILEQTCLAVEKAHQQGIIHRDLKPDNIWLEPNERGGFTVKVLDFGLAKLAVSTSDNQNKIENSLEVAGVSVTKSSNSSNSNGKIVSNSAFQEAVTNVQAVAPVNSASSVDSEGQTAVQFVSKSLSDEEKTNIQAPPSSSFSTDEEKTNIQLSSQASNSKSGNLDSSDEEKTAIQPSSGLRDTQKENSRQTQSQEKLTQAGAILGTPLYMSPEQCLGEELDKRSDIYSLGVIAYEMLAGELPFSGNLNALIMSHVSVSPPPLEKKRPDIPKIVAELIMQALSKKPEERPVSIAAFASALRARSESAGTLIRQALGVYAEHFSTFFQLGLIVALPSVVSVIITLSQILLTKVPKGLFITGLIFSVLHFIVGILAMIIVQAFNGGVFLPVLAQILIAPLKELSVAPIWGALKKKIGIFLPVSLLFNVSTLLMVAFGIFLLVLPVVVVRSVQQLPPEKLAKVFTPYGIMIVMAIPLAIMIVPILITIVTGLAFFNFYLCGAVVIIEGVKGFASLKRSRSLYKTAKKIAKPIIFLHLGYILIFGIFVGGIVHFVILPSQWVVAIIFSILLGIIQIASFVFVSPLLGICAALLYFKARQFDGELLKDILIQYQPEALSISNWQARIAKDSTSLLQSLRKSKT